MDDVCCTASDRNSHRFLLCCHTVSLSTGVSLSVFHSLKSAVMYCCSQNGTLHCFSEWAGIAVVLWIDLWKLSQTCLTSFPIPCIQPLMDVCPVKTVLLPIHSHCQRSISSSAAWQPVCTCHFARVNLHRFFFGALLFFHEFPICSYCFVMLWLLFIAFQQSCMKGGIRKHISIASGTLN